MDTFPKKIELLAPVGRWAVLDEVLKNGADAVYLAGKKYNMRMHRSDFNFDQEDIARVAEKVKEYGAKMYITINSLLSDDELDEIGEYLTFLTSIEVDAIIVQDLGLINLVNELGLKLPLHASTMMNIHSPEGAKAVSGLGIKRIICSRDIALFQVKEMQKQSGLEMEYFAHGDMCIAQSGQCYTSGILFGKSSNRGKCMKPCRWPHTVVNIKTGEIMTSPAGGAYHMATKDLCLLEFIPELADAGVAALKIEGRMRPPEFLGSIVKTYRKAIDDYLSDPLGYINDMHAFEGLYKSRVRDFSTCVALKKPDAGFIGSSGIREPLFLSTAGKEKPIDLLKIEEEAYFKSPDGSEYTRRKQPLLAVHVGSPAAADEAVLHGADWIYIGGEVSPLRGQQWGFAALKETICRVQTSGKKVGLLTPRVTLPRHLQEVEWFFEKVTSIQPDAVLVHNFGTLRLATKLTDVRLYADYSFNVVNRSSVELLKNLGVSQVMLSLEASFETLKNVTKCASLPIECMVHGPITGMLLEHCLLSMSLMGISSHDPCRGPCRYLECGLVDKLQHVYPIELDQYCRSHLLLSRDVACLNYIDYFCRTGIRSLRVEAQYYDEKLVGVVTDLYFQLIKGKSPKEIDPEKVELLIKLSPRGFSLGAYPDGIFECLQRDNLFRLNSSQEVASEMETPETQKIGISGI